MALFSNSGRQADRTRTPPGSTEPTLSVIAKGMRVVGEIETESVVKVEGVVEGSVHAKGQVLVADGGTIDGDIYTREAVVAGEVRGSIVSDGRVEIQPSSSVTGDITAPRIVIHDGANVNGRLKTSSPVDRAEIAVRRAPPHGRERQPDRAHRFQ